MSKEHFRKLLSLDLDRDIKESKHFIRKEAPIYESDLSHTSSNIEQNSNSLLGLLSIKTSTDDSKNSIKSEILCTYKRVSSLSEYIFKFKKLKTENNTFESNIFRKFNTNKKNLELSDLDADPNLSSEYDSTFSEASVIKEIKNDYSNNENNSKHTDTFGDDIYKHNSKNKFPIRNSENFKNYMKIEKSPLSFYLNTIYKIDTYNFNKERVFSKEALSFVKINKEINKKDLINDIREVVSHSDNISYNYMLKKNAINYILKWIRRHNELINGYTQNNEKKVKKTFYKNRRIVKKIYVKDIKNKKIMKELTYNENKKLLKNIWDRKNYLYNKKNNHYFLKFFFDYIISFYSKTKRKYLSPKRNLNYFERYVIKFLFQNLHKEDMFKFKSISLNSIMDKNEKIENVEEMDNEASFIFSEINENVNIGKGNIIFPGCNVIVKKAKIYIGENNLFEDNVTIINNTNKNMYIGNYNIFRSGTCITDSLKIGNKNYFDYKCHIYNSKIGCSSFIGVNMFIDHRWTIKKNLKIVDNILTNMNPVFVEENIHEINLRYNYLKNSE
ncbi:dynactin subunit 6, putative [Plasmodium gallinaceum]|uniref:Dynactin subunit 6 n=1 Tax=Plasmodium gallinaceum TaxID=5849 RepID=A0A1J1GQ40_PLAGA|nr:dynactin subunit 6, putative [Plasmodium gallinaceum]CRG93407.1 dynactin subunit 6, putative [Plasmodium gallinaceum]